MALKSKKTVKIIIITVIAAIIMVPVLMLLFQHISYLNYLEEIEANYRKNFKDFCEYVEENKEVYEEFSKYQISLYENENTNADMEIEREGEHQEWRDIVLNHISRARVRTNDNGVCVVYEKNRSIYDIVICYQNDVYSDENESETLVYITDNISVGLYPVR